MGTTTYLAKAGKNVLVLGLHPQIGGIFTLLFRRQRSTSLGVTT